MNLKLTRGVSLAALAHLTIESCNNYLPVVYPLLIESLHLSYTQVGTIALVATLSITAPQPIFGYLSDRWETQRLVTLSVLWIGLAMGLVGFAGSYSILLVIVGLGGIGSAMFHPPSAVLASNSGGEQKGAAMSVFSVSGNIGSAISPLLMTGAIAWMGLRGTSLFIPIGLIVAGFLYFQLGQHTTTRSDQVDTHTRIVKNGSLIGLVLLVLIVMLRSWYQLSLITYLPTWIEQQGLSRAAGGQILSLLLFSVGGGSLIGGIVSDRVDRWKVLAVSMGLMAPVLWFFLSGVGAFHIISVAIMGILIGSSFPVAIVMAQETIPRSIGMVSGLIMGIGWLPGGIGASFTGFVADRFSLGFALHILVIPPILGVVCSLLYAIIHRKASIREELSFR